MKGRLIETLIWQRPPPAKDFVAKLYRDAEWNEYRVEYYEGDSRLVGTSHHEDKLDARGTAHVELESMARRALRGDGK